MNRIVITVPIYKYKHNVFEQVAYKRLLDTMNKYKIKLILPQTMTSDKIDLDIKKENVVRFDDKFFDSTESYSRLCLSPFFYEYFIEYDYMLIYQLDAFVFSDKLAEFAGYGYDYIGAPLENGLWKDFHVGNGGFSLRKIDKTLDVVARFDEISKRSNLGNVFCRYEDLFLGYCGYDDNIDYKTASIDVAMRFSVQDNSFNAYCNISKRGLPFGVHRWKEEEYGFWKPIIENYGFTLPDVQSVETRHALEMDRKEKMLLFIPGWYKSSTKKQRELFLNNCGLGTDEKYVIWGAGYYGQKCLNLLRKIGLRVEYIVDGNEELRGGYVCGIEIKNYADMEEKNKYTYVIAVSGKMDEIFNCIICEQKDKRVKNFFSIWDDMDSYLKMNLDKIEGITVPYCISIL